MESIYKKQSIDDQKSINKIIYRCADEIDLPLVEKLKVLQTHKHDLKV